MDSSSRLFNFPLEHVENLYIQHELNADEIALLLDPDFYIQYIEINYPDFDTIDFPIDESGLLYTNWRDVIISLDKLQNNSQIYDIAIVESPITSEIYSAAFNFSLTFNCLILDPTKRETIYNKANELNVGKEMFYCLIHNLIRDRCIKNIFKISKSVKNIIKDYNTLLPDGTRQYNILDIAIKYDIPPLAILRKVLNLNRKTISNIIMHKVQPEQYLNEYNLIQFQLAEQYDFDSYSNTTLRRISAEEKEMEFSEFIRELLGPVNFKTENELKAEQMLKYGRYIATPDILFTGPEIIKINGKEVKWLDYKNFCGIPNTFMDKLTKKQIRKYKQYYGPGLVCYGNGYVFGLGMEDLLDLSGLVNFSRLDE